MVISSIQLLEDVAVGFTSFFASSCVFDLSSGKKSGLCCIMFRGSMTRPLSYACHSLRVSLFWTFDIIPVCISCVDVPAKCVLALYGAYGAHTSQVAFA